MSLLSLLIYIPVQIALLPLGILGVLLLVYRQLLVSKRLGVSQTAIEVINGRWTMHIFDIRSDEPTNALMGALSNTSRPGLWLTLFPLWLKHRISGQLFLYPRVPEPGHESIADLMVARTLYFDRIIERRIHDVEQFVIMGAGYDTRAYGPLRGEGVTFFELDQASVQTHKRQSLAKAGINADHVHFVPVDFEKEKPFEALIEAGFDPAKKSLLLWEGVTLYLTETDVRRALAAFRSSTAPGSVLLADIYGDRFLQFAARGAAAKVLEYTDEGVAFSLPFEADHDAILNALAESESLTVGERCFLGTANEKGPFAVVAEFSKR